MNKRSANRSKIKQAGQPEHMDQEKKFLGQMAIFVIFVVGLSDLS